MAEDRPLSERTERLRETMEFPRVEGLEMTWDVSGRMAIKGEGVDVSGSAQDVIIQLRALLAGPARNNLVLFRRLNEAVRLINDIVEMHNIVKMLKERGAA